jgi:hypothetical protein
MSLLTEFVATIQDPDFDQRTKQHKILFTMWFIQVSEGRERVSKKWLGKRLMEIGIYWDNHEGGGGGELNALKKQGRVEKAESSTAYWRVTKKGSASLEANYGAKLRAMLPEPKPEERKPEKPRKTGLHWL